VTDGLILRFPATVKPVFARYLFAVLERLCYFQNLAKARIHEANYDAATEALLECIHLSPQQDWAFTDLAAIYALRGKSTSAYLLFKRAVLLNPANAVALKDLGVLAADNGRHSLGTGFYRQSLRFAPGVADTRIKLAKSLLHQGDYPNGWTEYEARLDPCCIKTCLHAIPRLPRWDGSHCVAGEPLIIISEQGIGDTFQFMRYVRIFADKLHSAPVVFCVRDDLLEISSRVLSGISVIGVSRLSLVKRGLWQPLLSIPGILGVSPSNPICLPPYIEADSTRVAHWRRLIKAGKRVVVGIHWQGDPSHEHGDHKGRSIALDCFKILSCVDQVVLVSLQKGYGSERLAGCQFLRQFISCQHLVSASHEWDDTAAIMSLCDLIITNDTSVAHLSGAMGVQTWLLLKKFAEWRWSGEQESTFWYPSMRLFRQQIGGDWFGVMGHVATELQGFIRARLSNERA
jgi:hypothetical protein